MRVHRPTNNPLTQGYSSIHRGYDHAGNNLPDEVRTGMDGVIIEREDRYNTNWRNTGTLTTKDYGNYIKIKHDDGSYELHAHLRQGSSFVVGTRVKAGQVVARIGNTGNSTGPHIHSEYRNAQNQNVEVEFYQGGGSMPNMYGGLDLSNPESMKPCVDLFNKWKNGGLVEKTDVERNYVLKSEYEKLQVRISELERRPTGNPEAEKTLKEAREVLNKILQ